MSRFKIKTINELIDKLDCESAWRKKEIVQAKFLIDKESENIPLSFMQKSAILLVYANWEGFINKAANYYTVYVFSQKIPFPLLKTGFLEIKLQQRKCFDPIMNSQKQVVRKRFVDSLDDELHSKYIPNFQDEIGRRYISTDSNLTSEVFNNILELLGIDSSDFFTKSNLIDSILLNYRNSLAHGERGYGIELDNFGEVADHILKLMDKFKDSLIDSAIKKDYIRKQYKRYEKCFV